MEYEKVLKLFSEKGYKITPHRKEIVKLILSSEQHLSAKEVYKKLLEKYPAISFDTVYRNLHLLNQLKVLRKLDFQDGRSRFEVARDDSHHHHIVCLGCGETRELDICPMARIQEVVNDFEVIEHRFEVFGYCADCKLNRDISTQ